MSGAPCEDGFQTLVDDMATACNLVDNAWTSVRCVATEAATETEASACNAVIAPTSAQNCQDISDECKYLDPSTLPAVWEGWGCVAGTADTPECPVGCQAKIDHYCKKEPSLLLLLLF